MSSKLRHGLKKFPSVIREREANDLTVAIEHLPWESEYKPHSVLITHNGYQYSGFALTDINDVACLRDALTDYIEKWEEQTDG